MDAIANIKRQRDLAQAIIRWEGVGNEHAPPEIPFELAVNVLALDEWLQKGGFSPYGPSFQDAARTYLRASAEEYDGCDEDSQETRAWIEHESEGLTHHIRKTVEMYMSQNATPPPVEDEEE